MLQLAAEIRAVAGDIPIRVAPTPELERLLEMFVEQNPEPESASYLEGGRVPPESIASLFSAARYLWTIAPWKTIYDGQVIRLDVPEFDVRGAAISIIGNREESFGFLVFPSMAGYEAFERFAEKYDGGERFDFGTTVLSLDYSPGADLPARMRREIARHKWPVAGPDAFPVAVHRDRDGLQRPLSRQDVDLLAATAMALGTFYTKNEAILRHEVQEPVSMTISDENDVDVRFTYPYEAFALFSEEKLSRRSSAPAQRSTNRARDAMVPPPSLPHFVEPPRPAARVAKVGRNEPCPCGSGKKYKRCHLEEDEGAATPARTRAFHERIVERLERFAAGRFGGVFERAAQDFEEPEARLQLLRPWSLFHFEIENRSIATWFLEEQSSKLTPVERAWIETQRRTWLSIWEVQRVVPGSEVEVVDLLSGQHRVVQEISGTREMVKRDAFLGRVSADGNRFVLFGAHPRFLPPQRAADVVSRARKRLRLRRDVPVERLLIESFGRFLIAQWEEEVADMDLFAAIPPRIQNTDGDDLMLIVDRFEFAPKDRDTIAGRLASTDGVEAADHGALNDRGESKYVFVRPAKAKLSTLENTIVGRAILGATTLLLETNSTRRAKDLQRKVEKQCKNLIHYASRHEESTEVLVAFDAESKDEPREPPSAELVQFAREWKQRYYSKWLDESILALGGKTPRQAARLAQGRKDLEDLLKDMEHTEAHLPENERVDFDVLRAELGLRS